MKPESQLFINNQITSVPTLNFNKANFFNIKFELINLDWRNIFSKCINCDVAINTLIRIVIDMCIKHTPISKKKIYKYPLNIKILLNKCRKLHTNVKDQFAHKQWRDCQNKCSETIHSVNLDNEQRILTSSKKSSFFNYVNKQLHKTNTISPLKCIYDPSKINLTDIDKARYLSNQFSSIFTIPSTGIIHSFRKPSKFTPKLTFDKYLITPEIVRKCVCLLPNKFNISPDGLSKCLLQNLSFELCYPLSIVFTKILNDGICPLIWKKSNITALYKKGDSTIPSNYIPISILSSTLILYEKNIKLLFILLFKIQRPHIF